jgi:hypothetical protein
MSTTSGLPNIIFKTNHEGQGHEKKLVSCAVFWFQVSGINRFQVSGNGLWNVWNIAHGTQSYKPDSSFGHDVSTLCALRHAPCSLPLALNPEPLISSFKYSVSKNCKTRDQRPETSIKLQFLNYQRLTPDT